MQKLLKSTVGVLIVTAGFVMVSTAPASASTGYVGEAVNGLGSSPVYVDSDAALSNADGIAASLKNSNVDVVALPDVAVSTYSANDVADMIRQQTGETTVVVVDSSAGSDRVGVSSSQNEEKIATVLNQAIASHDGDAGEAIQAVSGQVVSLSAPASPVSSGADASVFGVVVGGGGALLLVAAVLVILTRSRRKSRMALPAGSNLIAIESGKSSEERLIENSIAALTKQMNEHQAELPLTIRKSVTGILQTLKELLPQWKEMDSYGDQKFTINNIITDYLPTLLNNYLTLPKSYLARSRKAEEAEGKVLKQVQLLQNAVDKIQDSVYEGVEQRIEEQGNFLQAKFTEAPETLKLR